MDRYNLKYHVNCHLPYVIFVQIPGAAVAEVRSHWTQQFSRLRDLWGNFIN